MEHFPRDDRKSDIYQDVTLSSSCVHTEIEAGYPILQRRNLKLWQHIIMTKKKNGQKRRGKVDIKAEPKQCIRSTSFPFVGAPGRLNRLGAPDANGLFIMMDTTMLVADDVCTSVVSG